MTTRGVGRRALSLLRPLGLRLAALLVTLALIVAVAVAESLEVVKVRACTCTHTQAGVRRAP